MKKKSVPPNGEKNLNQDDRIGPCPLARKHRGQPQGHDDDLKLKFYSSPNCKHARHLDKYKIAKSCLFLCSLSLSALSISIYYLLSFLPSSLK